MFFKNYLHPTAVTVKDLQQAAVTAASAWRAARGSTVNKEEGADLILGKRRAHVSLFFGLGLTIAADICQEIARFDLIIQLRIFRLCHRD